MIKKYQLGEFEEVVILTIAVLYKEAYGNSMFAVIHTAQVVDEKIVYGETHAFVGPRYLITVRHGASLSYAPVRERVEREPELLVLGPSYGLYAVLDFIVDNYRPILDEFSDTADSLEQAIFADTYSRDTVVRSAPWDTPIVSASHSPRTEARTCNASTARRRR